MGLSVVRYDDKGVNRWGVLRGQQIIAIEGEYHTLAAFLQEGLTAARKALANATDSEGVPLHEANLVSPVTAPARIVCQGANYGAHRAEAGLKPERPPFNLIFTKADGSLAGAYDAIERPQHVKLLDYEIELGLVIGKQIDRPVLVTEENLHEYVAGLVITNDISSRDVQFVQGQWYKGKSYRTFCPTGPLLYLLEKEDVPHIFNLDLKLWVNGELRQSSNTKQLLYKPDETLTELSEIMNLSAGDLLLTGTPGGVALHLTPEDFDKLANPFLPGDKKMEVLVDTQLQNPRYLKDGDVIKCEIKSPDHSIDLGVQENRVVAAPRHVSPR
jgi:2-keto-4-pentenoate hydratase/2-oxohepta-3-ene-1,7-dioic acid hydratase in catechol pathway